jgi:hypothetical protein
MHQVHAATTCSFLKWLVGISPLNVVWIVTGSAMATFWANLVETHTHGMQSDAPLDALVLTGVVYNILNRTWVTRGGRPALCICRYGGAAGRDAAGGMCGTVGSRVWCYAVQGTTFFLHRLTDRSARHTSYVAQID